MSDREKTDRDRDSERRRETHRQRAEKDIER